MYTLFVRHIAPTVLNFNAGLGSGKSFFVPSPSFSLFDASTSSATSGGWSQAAKNVVWESCSWSQTVGAQRGTKLVIEKEINSSPISSYPCFRSISIEGKSRINPWSPPVNCGRVPRVSLQLNRAKIRKILFFSARIIISGVSIFTRVHLRLSKAEKRARDG